MPDINCNCFVADALTFLFITPRIHGICKHLHSIHEPVLNASDLTVWYHWSLKSMVLYPCCVAYSHGLWTESHLIDDSRS